MNVCVCVADDEMPCVRATATEHDSMASPAHFVHYESQAQRRILKICSCRANAYICARAKRSANDMCAPEVLYDFFVLLLSRVHERVVRQCLYALALLHTQRSCICLSEKGCWIITFRFIRSSASGAQLAID